MTDESLNYFEFHLGSYARKTGHLSLLEHGVFITLLRWYYTNRRGIPDADRYRFSQARSDVEREAVDAVLREFFELVEGAWVNKTCEEVIAAAAARISAARENGKKGGRPKGKPAGEPAGKPKKTQRVSTGLDLGTPDQTQVKAPQTPPVTKEQDTSLRSVSPPSDHDRSPSESVIGIPLNDGSEFAVTAAHVAEFRRCYPAVDVDQTLRNIRGWSVGNPKNRKTRSGALKFITGWLAREQNKPRQLGAPHDHDRSSSRYEGVAERAARLAREGDEREARQAAQRGDAPPLGTHGGDLRPPLDVEFRLVGRG